MSHSHGPKKDPGSPFPFTSESQGQANEAGRAGMPGMDALLGPWRQLVESQVSLLRDLWKAGSGTTNDPAAWQARVGGLWGRWMSPGGWTGGATSNRAGDGGLQVLAFAIDAAAEATAEQRVLLPPGTLAGDCRPTPLRNVTGQGDIAADHIELHGELQPSPGGQYSLGVVLVDLGRVQQRLRSGELEPGLYIGAIVPASVAASAGAQTLAVVQAQLRLDPR